MEHGVNLRHRGAFWLGTAAILVGFGLHMPMFVMAKDDGYMLAGMAWDRWMVIGMTLVVLGLAAVVYGVGIRFEKPKRSESAEREFRALDASSLSPAHLKLMLVMTIAIAIDTQKPFTFTFILPGVAEEYDLRSPAHPAPGQLPVALWPFVAILGTVIGSLVWGHVADRLGRRATILIISALFMATAVCGAMPSLEWNLLMCFLMGTSAGGMLPIVYSLLTETMPVKRRGQLIVLVAGIGTAVGFLLASWTANLLIPTFGWRIMWFFGIPTGLALLLLNRHIPESPRFLLAHNRRDEAHAVMRRFGIVPSDGADTEAQLPEPAEPAPAGRLYRRPYRGITAALVVFGLSWGLVNFGFLVWLPDYVAKSGIDTSAVTSILAKAALFSIPGAIVVAWLYAHWGSKRTLIAAACLTAGSLAVFALLGEELASETALFTAMLVVLLVALWASVAVLAPYSAEVYPTAIRGIGSGVAAGATKLGGVFALALSVAAVAPPAIAGSALMAAIPAGLAAFMLLVFGIETRGRALEEISASVQRRPAPEAPAVATESISP